MTLSQFCTAAHKALVELSGTDGCLDQTESRSGLTAAIILARSLGRAEGELGKQAGVPVDPFAPPPEGAAHSTGGTHAATGRTAAQTPAALRAQFSKITDREERSAFYNAHRDQLFAR
ncbi:MAG: hypothetical protein ACYDH9_09665 [Limisphaerales bacterium]